MVKASEQGDPPDCRQPPVGTGTWRPAAAAPAHGPPQPGRAAWGRAAVHQLLVYLLTDATKKLTLVKARMMTRRLTSFSDILHY